MTPAERPIAAVFFGLLDDWLFEQLLRAWLAAGHRVAAVVAVARRRPRRHARFIEALEHAATPVVRCPFAVDWSGVAARLATVEAEVALSYAFPRLVPAGILACFPRGGLNFHPARLPAYPGPQPVECMVAERAIAEHGGLTLHRMSADFDRGAILAQATLAPGDFASKGRLARTVAATMAAMATTVVPLYCAGRVAERPQPPAGPWAAHLPRRIVLTPDWRADEIAAAGAFLNRRPGLFLSFAGRTLRIGPVRRRLGLPSGQAPVLRLFEIEFDCADARLVVARGHRAGRLLQRALRRRAGDDGDCTARPLVYDLRPVPDSG